MSRREWKLTTLSWHAQPGVTHIDFEEAADQRRGVPKLLPRLAVELGLTLGTGQQGDQQHWTDTVEGVAEKAGKGINGWM